MNEEAIGRVGSQRYKKKYILISWLDNWGKKLKGGLEWLGTSSRAQSLYCPTNTDNWRLRKVVETCVFLVLCTVTKLGRSRRRKKDTLKLSAVEGTEYRYRLTDADVRQRTKTKDIVEVAHSVKWKWRAHVAGMYQRGGAHVTSTWCLRIGKTRTGRPKT